MVCISINEEESKEATLPRTQVSMYKVEAFFKRKRFGRRLNEIDEES
jgi:hypothetical protein